MKLFLLLFCAGSIAGCATMESTSSISAAYPIATYPGSEIVTSSRTGSFYSNGTCLLFRDSGGISFLPVFKVGSRYNGRSVAIVQPNGERAVAVGQRVTIEGDGQEWTNVPTSYNLSNYQRQCSVTPFFIISTK